MESNLTLVAAIPLSDLFLLRGQVFNSDSDEGIVHLEQDFEETTKHLGFLCKEDPLQAALLFNKPLKENPHLELGLWW